MKIAAVVLMLMFALVGVATAQEAAPEAKVTPLLSKDLAGLSGKEITMITVEYPPGSVDPAHRHHAQALVYVIEGSIVMQLRGAEPVTVKAGEGFYEGPNDVHIVGRSASDSKPAKFVVFLVKNQGVPAVLPAK